MTIYAITVKKIKRWKMEENNKNVREVYYSFHTTKPFWIDFF